MSGTKRRYCVYILRCADDSLYTGMTCGLVRRLGEHQAGRGARWTKRRLPVRLVFSIDRLSFRSALQVERYIKSLTRGRKEALAAGDPSILSLVRKRAGEGPHEGSTEGRRHAKV